ncbi:MAG: ATP-binding cassette domain-containing protein [Planctomycetota bacterium]
MRAVERSASPARRAKVFDLLGPNGAGKTTTLRMLSEPPRADDRHGPGRRLRRAPPPPPEIRTRIGCLSGSTALYPRLTVRETWRSSGRCTGVIDDDLEARIETIAGALELVPWLDRRVEG